VCNMANTRHLRGRPPTENLDNFVCPRCEKQGAMRKSGMRNISKVSRQGYQCKSCGFQTVNPNKVVPITQS
jgi:predicted RNA-binding Zn-ribbon protein involved in translation (DUF1610 family)